MRKVKISYGLIKQLTELELPLIGLTELAEKSDEFASVTAVLRPILNELQTIILRIQCEANETPGGAK